MENRERQVLDYGRPQGVRIDTAKLGAVGAFICAIACALCSLFFRELLHNKISWPGVVAWAVFGVAATVLLIWRRRGAHEKPAAGRGLAIFAWLILVPSIVLGALSIYGGLFYPDPHVSARNRNYCIRHFESLYDQIEDYASKHGNSMPADLLALANDRMRAGEPLEAFTCPAAQPFGYASQPTTQAILNELATSPKYIYLGSHTKLDHNPKMVLAYDAPGNHTQRAHGGDGMHVLFADGSVVWLEGNAKQKFLSKIAAQTRPATQ